MMSIRSLADFNRSSLGGDGDWLTPPPSPLRPDKPGRHDERGMGTFNWPPARTSTWPYTGTFSWPRTVRAGQAAAVGGPQVVMNRLGGSGLVAAVFGSWQIRLVPRAAGVAGWLRNGLGVITGLAAVGAVRGAQLLLGPFQALRMGIGLMAVPEATRVLTRSRRRLNTFCVLLGGARPPLG